MYSIKDKKLLRNNSLFLHNKTTYFPLMKTVNEQNVSNMYKYIPIHLVLVNLIIEVYS